MMKKSLVLGSLLSTVCLASADAHTGYFKSGFLAGGHVGVGFGNGKFNATFTAPGAPGGLPSSVDASAKKTSPLLGVHVGYRQVLREGYTFAFIVEANLSGSSELKKELSHFSAPNAVPVTNKLKQNYNVIPKIVFGKIICGRYHASIGLGMPIARFKSQIQLLASSLNASQTKIGFAPSLGIEYAATPNVSVFGDVSYEMYKKAGKTYILNNAGTAKYDTSINPRQFVIKAGVSYRF